MRKPTKPGSEASRTKEGGALGNIDEETGHPGKGTAGATLRPDHNGSGAADKARRGEGVSALPRPAIGAGWAGP